jgi:phage gp29-like protein
MEKKKGINTAGKVPQIIVQNIDVRVPQRTSTDIQGWRSAIKSFENKENPIRTRLYDLYEDILLDGQIESTWGKRVDNILNKDLIFVKDGVEDELIGKLLNSPDMRQILSILMDTILWGYTAVQVNKIWWDADQEVHRIDYDLIPRKHVHPERNFQCISYQQSIITRDILFMQEPYNRYMIYTGNPTSMGLMAKIAQYVIYKRGGMGDMAQYAEMFGMPFRDCVYEDFDDATRQALVRMNENWGAAPWFVRPKSSSMNLISGESGAGNVIYKDMIAICDAFISKILVRNTLTTEQGEKGARALGEIHAESEDSVKESDEKFILSLLNTQIRAILKRFGFNLQGGEIWYRSPEKDWNALKTKWEVISGIKQKLPVDDDYVYEEFDIPKPENYEAMKEEMKATPDFSTLETQLQNPLKSNEKPKNFVGKVFDFFA